MSLRETDPEFVERLEYFIREDVLKETGQTLEDRPRYLAVLAALLGCQGLELYREVLTVALKNGLAAEAAREVVYQAVDYLGLGRVYPFLTATNQVFENCGIVLPLAPAATTTISDRREKGTAAQVTIFGEGMREAWKASHINRWLAANCFGDYYTREGLSLSEREMITFCFIAAQGGCEPQLIAHVRGNMNMGNDAAFLKRVVSQCLPYIGYPRSLNALAAVDKAVDE